MEDHVLQAIDDRRLIDTAKKLIAVPSPTLDAGAVADALEAILAADGFAVERPQANPGGCCNSLDIWTRFICPLCRPRWRTASSTGRFC